MPMRPDTTLAELQRRQDFLQAGILSVTARGAASAPAASALRIESDTVLYSTLTPAHGGRELRLYNCADTPAQAVVHMPALAGRTSVRLVNLEGEETAVLPGRKRRLPFAAWHVGDCHGTGLRGIDSFRPICYNCFMAYRTKYRKSKPEM